MCVCVSERGKGSKAKEHKDGKGSSGQKWSQLSLGVGRELLLQRMRSGLRRPPLSGPWDSDRWWLSFVES